MNRRDLIEQKLRAALSASHIHVEDESHLHAGHAGARGGAGHFRATVVSERFDGLSRIKRQQLVFSCLEDEMGPEIHALSMRTLTPTEWAAEGAQP